MRVLGAQRVPRARFALSGVNRSCRAGANLAPYEFFATCVVRMDGRICDIRERLSLRCD